MVSAKAYEALSKSSEVSTVPQAAQSQEQQEDEDRKKLIAIRKKNLIRFGSLAVFAFVVWLFATIAWFTASKDVGGSGMGVRVEANGFELEVSGSNIGYSDLYTYLDDSTLSSLGSSSGVTRTSSSHDTICWRIAGSDDQLKPGAQGELTFKIISSGTNVNTIKYNLEIECYSATIQTVNNVDSVTGLTKIVQNDSTMSQDKKNGANYLKSHLMFFTSRTGNSEDTWQYSGFITNINDFTLTPTATATEGVYTATIYWIWPNTLGQIALDSSLAADREYLSQGIISVLNNTGETNDRANIKTYLKTNPYVFKGMYTYSDLVDTLYNKRAVPESYQLEYERLSSGYNAADLSIGKNVDYVSVLLNANES